MSSVSVSTSSENVSTVSDKSKNKASASKAKLVTGIIGAVTILSVCIILAVYLLVLGFEESNESKELKESNASNASKELKEPKELKESKESNASKELKEPKETKELIFAHILFSNGAESGTYSPSFGSNAKEKFEKLFPRGKHQLTDRGSENSALLGKFLKKRYVDSGFLDQEINPVEVRVDL
uniref:Uncharacterized protein n=1 Tax=Caenorhabditis japonica TaxID=281687 RepID=A0A8R1HX79_CAEJA